MRLWRSAVVALALSSSFAVVSGASAAPPRPRDVLCGALRGTAVYGIRAQGMRCPEGRRLAGLHERAVKRRGRRACDFREAVCRVQAFWCSARIGMKPRVKDATVICGDVRNTRQVVFRYDHRKIRLPPPEPDGSPPQPEQPPSVTPQAVPVAP